MSEEEKSLISVRRYIPESLHAECHRAKAIALFRDGLGYKAAAKILGLSPYTVREWYREWHKGRFTEEIPERLKVFDEKTREEAIRIRRSCSTWREFTEKTGICATSCLRWMRAAEARKAADAENKKE